MPYSKISDAPANIRKLDNVSLSLSQVNAIARHADRIPEGQVDNPWAIAISNFKKTHVVESGSWVRKKELEEGISVTKEGDSYTVVMVSTAALKDREEETFSVEAIDYDLKMAQETGEYPEFRAFHKPYLAFGKVTKMERVGIFAVDTGYSYTDPFSISVCKELESDKSGKWRVSRGFRVIEVSGACPSCGNGLLIRKKHMVLGFRCPACRSAHMGYKGVLDNVTFLKTRTFDVTATTRPALSWTSATAYKDLFEEDRMNKKALRKMLLEAGFDQTAVDDRLKGLKDEELKEYAEIADLPDAVLKTLGVDLEDDDDEDDTDDNDDVVVDAEVVVKEIVNGVLSSVKEVVRKEVALALKDLTIEVPDVELDIPVLKEFGERLESMEERLKELSEDDDERIVKKMTAMPRGASLRIKRYKAEQDEEDEDDDEYYEDTDEEKELIPAGDGQLYESMSDFVLSDN